MSGLGNSKIEARPHPNQIGAILFDGDGVRIGEIDEWSVAEDIVRSVNLVADTPPSKEAGTYLVCDQDGRFFVPGLPATAGSKKGFVNKYSGKVMMVDTCARGKTWRHDVQWKFRESYDNKPLEGPVALNCIFRMPRPKGHYGSGRNAHVLKPNAPTHPITKPDCTKMVRAIEDALTGLAWLDDSQVVVQHNEKVYADEPCQVGASVAIRGEGGEE